jgi:hypothetical protein
MIGQQANHLLAFFTDDMASAATNVAAGAVADQAVTFAATTFFLADPARVRAAYIMNDALTDVRLNSPSLRDPFLPHFDPLRVALTVPDVPPVALYGDDGPEIPSNENFSLECTRGAVAASDVFGLLWLNFGTRPAPFGKRIKARFTASITGVIGSWTLGAITLTDTLPAGDYAVVGMSCYGTGLLAARLVFQGGGYRPGVLCQQAQGEWNGPSFSREFQGELGRFKNTVQPNLETLIFAANTAQIGYLDLISLN